MANYYESARTNYFRVKDETAFKAFIDTVPGAELVTNSDGLFAVLFPDEGVPSSRYVEKDGDEFGDYEEFDLMGELADHLADGSIAILMASGAEKLRYVSGYAEAVDNTGKTVRVSINDIYKLAKQEFGEKAEVTPAEY